MAGIEVQEKVLCLGNNTLNAQTSGVRFVDPEVTSDDCADRPTNSSPIMVGSHEAGSMQLCPARESKPRAKPTLTEKLPATTTTTPATFSARTSPRTPSTTTSPAPQFDFVHIRYEPAGLQDGPRIFRLAFEQTKPGGWIEVVETGPPSTPTPRTSTTTSSRASSPRESPPSTTTTTATTKSTAATTPSSKTATQLIRAQLLAAGFTDVEVKGTRRRRAAPVRSVPAPAPASTHEAKNSGLLGRLAGVVRGLWAGVVKGVRWECGVAEGEGCRQVMVVDEKEKADGGVIVGGSPRVFVIARRP